MLRLMLYGVVSASLLVSPNLMYILGIEYGVESGSLLEKIHISTTLALLTFAVYAIYNGKLYFTAFRPTEFFLSLGICGVMIATLGLIGRPVTSLLVTFLTPILLVYLLSLSNVLTRLKVGQLFSLLLFLNSVVGIIELLSGSTFLPRVAGAVLVFSDTRSIGFVGHPLTSSFLTGLILLYLVLSRMMARFDPWALVQIVVHAVGLLAFGGRVALVSAAALIAIYIAFDGKTLVRRTATLRTLRRSLIVGGGLALIAIILFSGIADNTLSRFTSDEGSALTRNAALQIVSSLGFDELALGVSPSQRVEIMRAFGTDFGIEITWIALLVDYGVFITIGLCIVLAILLRICLRGGQRYHWYMTVYFLICITGSQGLGSKTLLLAWFVTIMLTFGRDVSAVLTGRTPETGSRAVPALA